MGLNHWGYFIFIDTFSAVQEEFNLHLAVFVQPSPLAIGRVNQCFPGKAFVVGAQ